MGGVGGWRVGGGEGWGGLKDIGRVSPLFIRLGCTRPPKVVLKTEIGAHVGTCGESRLGTTL